MISSIISLITAPLKALVNLISVSNSQLFTKFEFLFEKIKPKYEAFLIKKGISQFAAKKNIPEWLKTKATGIRPIVLKDEDLLVHGKIREYAERVAPPGKFIELYSDVPKDLKRSIISDGRTINGKPPAVALAGTTVTTQLVTECYEDGMKSGIFYFSLISFVLLVLQIVYLVSIGLNFSSLSISIDPIGNDAWDMWPGELTPGNSSTLKLTSIAAVFEKFTAVLGFCISAIFSIIPIAIIGLGIGRVVWWTRFAGLFSMAVNQAVAPLRSFEGEAKIRYRSRMESRESQATAYRNALNFIEKIDHSPVYKIGSASGAFDVRGQLGAPGQGQDICVSVVDFLQHGLVTGSSGEGKTRNVLKPLIFWLVSLRKSGLPVSTFVMDDKSVLWVDLVKAAKICGLQDELRVIGVEDNQWRVDLLEGIPPTQVSEIVQSVVQQMAGEQGQGDSFWPEMAGQLILEIATLLHAHQFTDVGREWEKLEGIRVYSLRNILRVAQSDSLIHQVIADVLAAMEDDIQYMVLRQVDGLALWSAIDAQLLAWVPLAEATKTSILANARMALRMFAFNPVISRGFGDGAGKNLMSPADLHGNFLTAVAINATEHGSAGRLVLIALKSLLFRQARALEAIDPSSAEKRLAWWNNPDPQAADSSKAITFVIMDEYQGLASKGDEEFFAVARSTGTAVIVATQSISAIETVMGKASTSSLVNNLRTKIFLGSEDESTMNYASMLTGTTKRSFVRLTWESESYAAVLREWGFDAENMKPATIAQLLKITQQISVDASEIPIEFKQISAFSIDISSYGMLTNIPGRDFETPVDLELVSPLRFQNKIGINLRDSETNLMNKQKDRYLNKFSRLIDPTYSERNDNPSEWIEQSVLQKSELKGIGRGRAVVFAQRGGFSASDIVDLV